MPLIHVKLGHSRRRADDIDRGEPALTIDTAVVAGTVITVRRNRYAREWRD
jgi:hypothetical protein